MVFKVRQPLTFISIFLVLLLAGIASGQVLKGSISGTATDPQGAVLSGAQVKATNLGTGAVFNTTTDSSGLFRFNLIPAGEYKVEISAPGFRTAVQNNVAVIAGRDSGLSAIKLQVGDISTTVEVTAEAPLIESTQAQVTNTFAGAVLTTTAGVQENQGLDNLALFVPGVASSRDNNFSNFNGGQGFTVNGLRGRNNDQQIDGQNNNDNSVAGPGLFLTDTEFVGQYVLITNQFGPEYGRNAGSVVNIITKSGTNNWHGSVFGNVNNSVFNSMSNFQKNFATDAAGNPLTHPPRANDTFAGTTIGGPWIKNKLFVFGGFDTQILSTNTPMSSTNLTPTPAGLATLAACFPGSTSIAALTKFGPYGISGGNPFPINPTPQTVTGCASPVEFGGVTRVVPTPVHTYDFIVRTDAQLGSDTLTGRYIYNRTTFFNLNDNGAAGYVFNEPALAQAVLASWTHNFTSRMVNEARVSYGRLNVEFGGNSIGSPELTADHLDQSLANVTFSDNSLLGFGPATNLPQQRFVNTWQGQDNWNYVMGKHQLKAGVNYTYQRSPNIFLPNINGQYRFADWSAFAANTPNRVRIANGPSSLDFREHDTFVYLGDDWKARNDLTLNMGITWTYYGQPANLFHDITTERESNPATAFWDPSLPLSVRTFPKIDTPTNSFGPSLGFAWAPTGGGALTGHGKTVIRGGYRYLYDPPFYNIYLNIATSAPEVFLQSFSATSSTPASSFPLPAAPIGPNVRTQLAPALTKGVLDPRTQAQTRIPTNFGPDKVHSWSLGIERGITRDSAIEARYIGNHGYQLFQTLDGNPFIADLARDFPSLVQPGLTPCTTPQVSPAPGVAPGPSSPDFGRAVCGEGLLRLRANTGFSNYNGVQVEFRANNLFKQLTVRTGYTFSKTLDNVSEIFSTFGAGNTLFTAQNPANQIHFPGEYSFSGLDYPHTWTILFTEQLPFYKDQHGFLGHLIGGWGFSGNYLIQSGQRYTPSQFSGIAAATAAGDYYDNAYLANFALSDTARPFLGNLSAPATSVGGFAQDICNLFGSGTLGDATSAPCAGFSPAQANQLFSMTAFGQSCLALTNPTTTCAIQPVSQRDVRFILNASTAQSVFGTPFGNTPRNPVQDEMSNIANFSIFKRFKLSERAGFEFHATALNVFNHSNFASVDPFIEDAGLFGNSNALTPTGFGNVKASDNVPGIITFQGGPNEASRKIIVGGKITF